MSEKNSSKVSASVKVHAGKEVWKDIAGYEGKYQVSNWGRVKSLRRPAKVRGGGVCWKNERILKSATNMGGYQLVCLFYEPFKSKMHLVHRLALETFVGTRPEGMECRHLDGNPANNHLDNLRWGTRSENSLDKWEHGTASRIYKVRLTADEVRTIRFLCDSGDHTQGEVSRWFGISPTHLNGIVHNKTWKHAGTW